MTPCKRAAELITRSLETPLNWRERLALALHLCVCDLCRRFGRQMRLIQRAGPTAGQAEEMSTGAATLSEEARQRIKQALREQDRGAAN